MSIQAISSRLFFYKLADVYRSQCLTIEPGLLLFSDAAMKKADADEWDMCALELRNKLYLTLGSVLSSAHAFEEKPYVRQMALPDGKSLRVAIINQQSKEWYGAEHTASSFDFVHESQRGVFNGCSKFLDLGGHQLVWSTYYALTSSDAYVRAFEPSIINAAIGLFNCLINGVIDRVDVVPFAVAVVSSSPENDGSGKMLVDFMTIPLRTCRLDVLEDQTFDFVKTDIEGYEYELLSDAKFVQLSRNAKRSHFELHLGHLINRGVSREDCVVAMRAAGMKGVELYSETEMYHFLESCDRRGFYSFLIG